MSLDFWAKTSGTWINVFAILAGTVFGLVVQGRLPQRMQTLITQSVGLTTVLIGLNMANQLTKVQAGILDGIVVGLLALVLGGLLGEGLQLEERLTDLGNWLKKRLGGQGQFTEGFVAASLLFCIGPMAILGSLNNGLLGDNRILVIKALMDGLTSIALSGSFGLGVGASTLMILLYQGGLSMLAGNLAAFLPSDPANAPTVLLITGIGGLMLLGLSLNLLKLAQIRIAAWLPSLFLGPLLYLAIKAIR